MHAQHAEELAIRGRIGTQTHQSVGHRVTQHVHQGAQLVCGVAEQDATAGIDVGALGRQQQLQRFFTGLQQKQSFPSMPEVLRHILLFNLAYLLYKLQLDNKTLHSFPSQLAQQLKALMRQFWWSPRFSARKKLNLAFAAFFFRWERNKS